MTKYKILTLLENYGIDYVAVIRFIKEECWLREGFESQVVGIKTASATTTGIITYILNQLNELSIVEQRSLQRTILSYEKKTKDPHLTAFGTQAHVTVWTTSLCLLGLINLTVTEKEHVYRPIRWLCEVQSSSGAWSFSGVEKEKVIYTYFAALSIMRYYERFKDDYVIDNIHRTYEFVENYKPYNNMENIIIQWLALMIENRIKAIKPKQFIFNTLDFMDIIENEFDSYKIIEPSVYPFSMIFYTPSSYLFTRHLLSPSHPFNLYLIKYLVLNKLNNRSWSHIDPLNKQLPFSFCTALAIFTLYLWAKDMLIHDKHLKNIPSLKTLEYRISKPLYKAPRVFISHSSVDEKMATRISNYLKRRGYYVWYSPWELKVGDSIIDKVSKGIRESDFLLILLSRASLKSKWVREELNAAKIKEIERKDVFILPVKLEKCIVPTLISDKLYADIGESFQQGMKKILGVLDAVKYKRNKNNK